ncbi:hypothetical protein EYC84_006571 [Monilinia fructicola]|uniref:Uncharacterized protein n=1 Tax=Monilinia fructicola TaxID=38448 RepID=A0A5M9K4C2_MONFR|nr:hypothetical protein EYC84_006571 [Monilinia fructicola]
MPMCSGPERTWRMQEMKNQQVLRWLEWKCDGSDGSDRSADILQIARHLQMRSGTLDGDRVCSFGQD